MPATPPPLPPAMNHVFVDFENVHEVDLSLVGAESVCFTLMMGAKQTKLDTDLVERLVKHASCVKLVRMKSSAKDAVDFALAYYLGQAVLAEPGGYYHLISKDSGYDPLIDHLRERQIDVRRVARCADLAFDWPGKAVAGGELIAKKKVAKKVAKKAVAKKAPKKTIAKKVVAKEVSSAQAWTDRVVENFVEHPKARPAKRKTLQTKVGDLIKKPVDGAEVQAVIEKMVSDGQLKFDKRGGTEYFL